MDSDFEPSSNFELNETNRSCCAWWNNFAHFYEGRLCLSEAMKCFGNFWNVLECLDPALYWPCVRRGCRFTAKQALTSTETGAGVKCVKDRQAAMSFAPSKRVRTT
jgi:hypothetical protein